MLPVYLYIEVSVNYSIFQLSVSFVTMSNLKETWTTVTTNFAIVVPAIRQDILHHQCYPGLKYHISTVIDSYQPVNWTEMTKI